MALHSAPSKQQVFASLYMLMKDAVLRPGHAALVDVYGHSVLRLGMELEAAKRIPRK